MNIKITRIILTNFKCFRHKEIVFHPDITTISGRNGSGKTTIADAILFCLFGKNTAGQSDLELFKTRENGSVIPNLDHSVEMEICVRELLNEGQDENAFSAKTLTLRRTIKEVWVKKRGSDEQVFKNNTVEYYVNGELQTKGDYEKYIASIVNERIFRTITNPTYFPSLKWQEQRSVLTSLTDNARPECDTPDLQSLLLELSNYSDDVEAYLKHLKYQIKQVKDKLDKIPVRLEEQHKALPELLNWSALQAQLTAVTQQIGDIDATILQIKAGNGADLRKEQLREQLATLYDKKAAREEAVRRPLYEQRTALTNAVAEASRRFNSLLNDQRNVEAAIHSFDTLSERCKDTLSECERDAEVIRKEWADNLARTLSWGDDDICCPTCGQPLPQDQLMERRQQVIERLNKSKAEVKAYLTDRANKVKALRAEAEKNLQEYTQRKQEDEEKLAKIKQDINDLFSYKQMLERKVVPSFEETIAADEEYQGIVSQISETKEELQNASVTTEEDRQALASLEEERNQSAATARQLQSQLATRTQYDRIQALIDSINAEQRDLITQLSELEKQEDTARRYQFRQNQLLEEGINRHFKLVQWRLFRTVNNGGDAFQEPYCEAYVNGIPYHAGLNQAAQLNAGLDICEALSTYYNTYAPIAIDNAESNLDIYPTTGQQVRLCVENCDLAIG